ncbi:nucleoside hydrolase [Paraburkholderia sp.]|uniref:nucleoside hydrolase n=1 Tax=Paraburkholderia sp. TaxID=1926495 RepID=UPI0039E40536
MTQPVSGAKRKIIIDTDPAVGIRGTDADDPLAILLALASPELDLIGVTTTFGNCPTLLTARCALAVLQAAGRPEIPVCAGLTLPLCGRHHTRLLDAWQRTRGSPGSIALPELEGHLDPRHASDFIIEQAHRYPGELEIVAIGPQTNVATAILKDPSICTKLRGITFMGGALGIEPVYGRGNITPVAECNIWFDPQAAAIVFESGIPLTMVGLDVTSPAKQTVLYEDQLQRIDATRGNTSKLLASICNTYLDSPMFELGERRGCVLYDPLAVAVCADATLVTLAPMRIAVEQKGEYTVGQTVPVRDGEPNINVCVDVDGERAANLILERLLTL